MSETTNGGGNAGERMAGFAAAHLPWIAGALALGVLADASNVLDAALQWSAKPSQDTRLNSSLWLIVPAACNVGALVLLVSGLRARAIAALAGMAVAWVLCVLAPGLLWLSYLVPLWGVVAWWRARQAGVPAPMYLVGTVLLTIVLTLAAAERFQALEGAMTRPLDPDATTFLDLAKKPGVYNTGFRGAPFVWMLKLVGGVTGSAHAVTARLMSAGISLAAVAAVFVFGVRFFGMLAGFVGGLLYARADYLVHFTAVQGLREESIILLFIWFAAVMCRAWTAAPRWRDWMHLALVGALLLLLRLHSGVFLAAAFGVLIARQLWAHRQSWRMAWLPAAAMLIAYLPSAPFLLQCRTLYGDPFFVSAMGARFYSNMEFAGVHPDFPTKEQVQADGYAGPPISMGQYLFKYHSLPQIIARAAAGAAGMTVGYHGRVWAGGFKNVTKPLFALLAWVQALALAALLLDRNGRVLLLLLFVFHAPVFYLVGTFPLTIGVNAFDPRLLTVAYVGYCLALGWLCQYAANRITAPLRRAPDVPGAGGKPAVAGSSGRGRPKRRPRTQVVRGR